MKSNLVKLFNKIRKFFNTKKRIFKDSFYLKYDIINDWVKNNPSKRALKPKGFNTHITIKCLNNGKLSAPVIETENTTVYNGRVCLHDIFGHIANPNQHLTLNQIENINHSVNVYDNDGSNKNRIREIKYFCIGNGAESKTVKESIIAERSSDTKLYKMVPFRCVPIDTDLTDKERQKYKLRKIIQIKDQQYIAYYAKAISSMTFTTSYNNQNYTPVESDTSTLPDTDPSKPLRAGQVLCMTTLVLKIEPDDFKEYYKATNNGSLTGAKLNEFGLIYAHEAVNTLENSKLELAGAELFSKITHSNINYESDGAESEFKYAIYS